MATYRVFKLEITAANSAFGDTDETRAVEIANILRRFADRLELRPTDAHLFDSNGNLVGGAGFHNRRER